MFVSNLLNKLSGRYTSHPEAVIVSCYFNPTNSKYRKLAFEKFYNSIKHLNHRIVECVIGDGKPQLPKNENISTVRSSSLLWHKESLLNKLIQELPAHFKYVFWLDADILFTNKNWMVDGVRELQTKAIIQPFEVCVHLERGEEKPSYPIYKNTKSYNSNGIGKTVWRSFCANYVDDLESVASSTYNIHGHVGFAWGARRLVLEMCPLYDKALIGGADHIIAHAAANQFGFGCPCIEKTFANDIESVKQWASRFSMYVSGKIGYVKGNVYHIWHGDLNKRKYFERTRQFGKRIGGITKKDKNGLYKDGSRQNLAYMAEYFAEREVGDSGFLNSLALGYAFNSGIIGGVVGGNMLGGVIGDALNGDNPSDSGQQNIETNATEQDFAYTGADDSYTGAGGSFEDGGEDSNNSAGYQ